MDRIAQLTMPQEPDTGHYWNLTRMQIAQGREVFAALIETNFDQTQAATKLGVSRPCVRHWIKLYHITKEMVEKARDHWAFTENTKCEWQLIPLFYSSENRLCVPTSL